MHVSDSVRSATRTYRKIDGPRLYRPGSTDTVTGKDGMASIEEVKAAIAQAADQGNTTLNQIRAAVEGTEQVLARLRAVAAGTGHAKLAEAIHRAEQSKQRLDEAAALAQGSSHAARDYIGILG